MEDGEREGGGGMTATKRKRGVSARQRERDGGREWDKEEIQKEWKKPLSLNLKEIRK